MWLGIWAQASIRNISIERCKTKEKAITASIVTTTTTPMIKLQLVLVLHLIGWENGTSFVDQLKSEVKETIWNRRNFGFSKPLKGRYAPDNIQLSYPLAGLSAHLKTIFERFRFSKCSRSCSLAAETKPKWFLVLFLFQIERSLVCCQSGLFTIFYIYVNVLDLSWTEMTRFYDKFQCFQTKRLLWMNLLPTAHLGVLEKFVLCIDKKKNR